jgi:biopolymer transport protein TolQ
VSFDVFDLILQAGLIVKLVLLLLAGFSVVSWGLIAVKWWELRSADQDSEAFLEIYQNETFDEAFEAARHLDQSPLAVIFLTCCADMTRLAQLSGQPRLTKITGEQMQILLKVIRWTAVRERTRLDRHLPFLATVGSASPFIGLFGTVVGIIATFQSIGQSGNASLAVVGPGMAEALIATGVGLAAAIPATIAYNAFVGRIETIGEHVDLFGADLEGDLSRLDAAYEPAPGIPGR